MQANILDKRPDAASLRHQAYDSGKAMRVGLLARADDTGLGVQTVEFYRHMKPFKTLIVDSSHFRSGSSDIIGNKQYPERYGPEVKWTERGYPITEEIEEFLKDLDLVFTAETPYNPYLWERARQLGVKTVQQYNYEFLDYLSEQGRDWPRPDLFASPSTWHHDDLPFENKMVLPVPIDRERCAFKPRLDPTQFLHIAGNPVIHDRNGTHTVLAAVKFVRHPHFRLYVRTQKPEYIEGWRKMLDPDETRVNFITEPVENYWDNYDVGNILLMPRRFGGLCLPAQEATSCGMPVIMTDIQPNNDMLPRDWLLPARKVGEFKPRTTVDIYSAHPLELARQIDRIIAEPLWLESQSIVANNIAKQLDWETWVPMYNEVFEKLCTR